MARARYNLIIIMLVVVAKRSNERTNLLTQDARSAGEHLKATVSCATFGKTDPERDSGPSHDLET